MPPQIEVRGLEGIGDLIGYLAGVEAAFRDSIGRLDLKELGRVLVDVSTHGYARMVLEGRDVRGRKLPRVTKETLKRRARAKKGAGPALSPDVLESSPFRDLNVRVSLRGNAVVLGFSWPNSPWLARHAEGIKTKAGIVVRDVVGPDLGTLREMEAQVMGWLEAQLGGGDSPIAFRRGGSGGSHILGRLRGR